MNIEGKLGTNLICCIKCCTGQAGMKEVRFSGEYRVTFCCLLVVLVLGKLAVLHCISVSSIKQRL